jgi:hypothetical protein
VINFVFISRKRVYLTHDLIVLLLWGSLLSDQNVSALHVMLCTYAKFGFGCAFRLICMRVFDR